MAGRGASTGTSLLLALAAGAALDVVDVLVEGAAGFFAFFGAPDAGSARPRPRTSGKRAESKVELFMAIRWCARILEEGQQTCVVLALVITPWRWLIFHRPFG